MTTELRQPAARFKPMLSECVATEEQARNNLLDELWAHWDQLPEKVQRTIHALAAHAFFEQDPETQQRKAEIKAKYGVG